MASSGSEELGVAVRGLRCAHCLSLQLAYLSPHLLLLLLGGREGERVRVDEIGVGREAGEKKPLLQQLSIVCLNSLELRAVVSEDVLLRAVRCGAISWVGRSYVHWASCVSQAISCSNLHGYTAKCECDAFRDRASAKIGCNYEIFAFNVHNYVCL